jgi:hypothetical protein
MQIFSNIRGYAISGLGSHVQTYKQRIGMMPFTVNRTSTKGLKIDLWLIIMLVKQAYLY